MAGMNYWGALAVLWRKTARPLGPYEHLLLSAYLHIWNSARRPGALDLERWGEVMDLLEGRMSRAKIYTVLQGMVDDGWLSVHRRGRTMTRVGLGVLFQSTTETGESTEWTGESTTETGESTEWTGESTTETALLCTRESKEKKGSLKGAERESGPGLDAGIERRLCALFQRAELSREERRAAGVISGGAWEAVLAFHAAPASDLDDRRHRRRSLGALLGALADEANRAQAWLDSEAGKPFRPRKEGDWRARLQSLPEDVLPGSWREEWLTVWGVEAPDWCQVSPKNRQTFLACMRLGMQSHQIETNQQLARRTAEQWLQDVAREEMR